MMYLLSQLVLFMQCHERISIIYVHVLGVELENKSVQAWREFVVMASISGGR